MSTTDSLEQDPGVILGYINSYHVKSIIYADYSFIMFYIGMQTSTANGSILILSVRAFTYSEQAYIQSIDQ